MSTEDDDTMDPPSTPSRLAVSTTTYIAELFVVCCSRGGEGELKSPVSGQFRCVYFHSVLGRVSFLGGEGGGVWPVFILQWVAKKGGSFLSCSVWKA